MAASYFFDRETAMAGPNGEIDGSQDLVVGQRRLPGRLEEIGGGDRARAMLSGGLDGRIQRQRYCWQFAGRVGVGNRPAHRATIADLEVTDVRQGGRQQRDGGGDLCIVFGSGLADNRTDSQRRTDPLDPVQALDHVQVDEMFEGRKPQRQQRDQTLSTSERLDCISVFSEQGCDLVQPFGRVIGKRRRLHECE